MKELLKSGIIKGQQAVVKFKSSSKPIKRFVPTLTQYCPIKHRPLRTQGALMVRDTSWYLPGKAAQLSKGLQGLMIKGLRSRSVTASLLIKCKEVHEANDVAYFLFGSESTHIMETCERKQKRISTPQKDHVLMGAALPHCLNLKSVSTENDISLFVQFASPQE